ncbi:hypothetical protein [Usitatibacter palustris]|uniref:CBM6 domain-containing protein n=1 Tax=Usitatibacter palustris TaxID=2732487 RepID=A0A6M4H4G1_9PROT|nr:hypothetical protein [Usitatibacter palustris]QJR13384.1 hypothetical protein DSM104440_00167 [Usitatibacter palustris]
MRTLSSIFGAVAVVVTAMSLAPVPALAHDKLGANLNFIGDFRRNHEFVDVVKQSRRFLQIGQFDDSSPTNLAPIGADGWPTTDFRLFAMAAQQNTLSLAGTYKIEFTGQATLSTASAGGGSTIANKVYTPGTNTTTADLVVTAGAENMLIDFTATGGTVKNVRVLRPGYPLAGTPLLHAPWKSHTERFAVLRFLDWTRTNGNRDTTWLDRTTPEKRRTEAYIAQWETVIAAANAMNRDAWINIPVQANDEYVTNLATLFRDGLNPNLNLYVEYGNELWNFAIRDVDLDNFAGSVFNGATVNRNLAIASLGGSPLRQAYPSEGVPDDTTMGFRRVAMRLMEISNIFKTVWGTPALNTRVRPVLAGQMANSFIVSEGLRFIDEIMNVRPNTVFYALSGAPYIFAAAIPDGNADETPTNLTVQAILDGLAAGVANAPSDANAYQYLSHAGLGAWYGLKVVAYEAGFDNFGNQNIANKRLANLDPQIRTICANMINQWHGFGFDVMLWFNGGADSYNTQFGMWPLVEDLAVPATPKNQCMDDILAAALPAVTTGTSVGAPIAGGNFRGSASPAGTVTGTNGAFGFPGFVEFMLRADTEGTYQLVFTGSAPPGEFFTVRLNNATVTTNATLPAATGAGAPISVTLRRGLNALRIARSTGGGASWAIQSFAFTLVGDATPDAFTFASQTGVTPSSVVVSAPATIAGITMATSISVAGGEYSIGCTATFTASTATITNGQTVCVRHTASANFNAGTTTTLTIGGISASFTSTTGPPPNPPRLANISTRGQVLTGNDVMIAGFIIGGPTAKTVIVTVAGPSLVNAGIPNALANPHLTLIRSSDGAVMGSSDNWQDNANAAAIQAAGFAPAHVAEPAVMMTLAPGAYTAIVQASGGVGTGVGLVGVFEVDHPEVPLINISTRGQVLTGNDVMIAGFIIQGTGTQSVVVTVAGPSLVNAGIPNPLSNPMITIVRASDGAVIASNDNWQTQTNPGDVALIQNAGFAPASTLEPAVFLTLPPGAYTAVVQGVGNVTGVGLVGVFRVP